ncbi:hypothetical protein [Myxococcus stipitatus]|uniref:hypothetical protein n=1 Tax=Myxococcus stipitatus TaxID=83455 RepID=UPI0030CFEFB9
MHKDDLHIFNFIIQGRKTMSFWPFETLPDRPELPRDDPKQLRDDLALIHLKDEDERQMLAKATFSWKMPNALKQAQSQRGQRANVLAANRASTEAWVRFLTTGAMDGTPPEGKDTAPLSNEDWVRAHPSRPIVTSALTGNQLLVAANGRSSTLEVAAPVKRRPLKLVATLNTGTPVQVKELEDAFFDKLGRTSFKRSAFRTLMGDLLRWRAVQRSAETLGEP